MAATLEGISLFLQGFGRLATLFPVSSSLIYVFNIISLLSTRIRIDFHLRHEIDANSFHLEGNKTPSPLISHLTNSGSLP